MQPAIVFEKSYPYCAAAPEFRDCIRKIISILRHSPGIPRLYSKNHIHTALQPRNRAIVFEKSCPYCATAPEFRDCIRKFIFALGRSLVIARLYSKNHTRTAPQLRNYAIVFEKSYSYCATAPELRDCIRKIISILRYSPGIVRLYSKNHIHTASQPRNRAIVFEKAYPYCATAPESCDCIRKSIRRRSPGIPRLYSKIHIHIGPQPRCSLGTTASRPSSLFRTVQSVRPSRPARSVRPARPIHPIRPVPPAHSPSARPLIRPSPQAKRTVSRSSTFACLADRIRTTAPSRSMR